MAMAYDLVTLRTLHIELYLAKEPCQDHEGYELKKETLFLAQFPSLLS